MNRLGRVIKLKEEAKAEYLQLHQETWPSILEIIARANIRNYSIFLREPENLLFAYMEYHGEDLDADMAALTAQPEMQRWWAITDPMQTSLNPEDSKEHWAQMDQVFWTDLAPQTFTKGEPDESI